MKKVRVYIDFEAISMPFSKYAKIDTNLPYAYTLGVYVNRQMKYRTYIFNFAKEDVRHMNKTMKIHINNDIGDILNKKHFRVSKANTEFIGWSPFLENRIVKKIFPLVTVSSLNKGCKLSLTRLTPEIKTVYFKYVKTLIHKIMTPTFIEKRAMTHDGAVAAFVGYLLYSKVHNSQGKFFHPFDVGAVVREIKKYSKDDVRRMHIINSNPLVFNQRQMKATKLLTEKNALGRTILSKHKMVRALGAFDQGLSIASLVKQLKRDITKLEDSKQQLDDKFTNLLD